MNFGRTPLSFTSPEEGLLSSPALVPRGNRKQIAMKDLAKGEQQLCLRLWPKVLWEYSLILTPASHFIMIYRGGNAGWGQGCHQRNCFHNKWWKTHQVALARDLWFIAHKRNTLSLIWRWKLWQKELSQEFTFPRSRVWEEQEAGELRS